MLRRHHVRGYNEKIYYAESSGNSEKIQQIEFHNSKLNEITKKEIYQLAGSRLVAFESDYGHISNDLDEEATENQLQSMYIMDDQQKIYHIKNPDGVRFETIKVIDFSHHKKIS